MTPTPKRERGGGEGAMRMMFVVPIRATFTLNSREHWAQRARKRKAERDAVALSFKRDMGPIAEVLWGKGYQARMLAAWQRGAVITLTRIGPRRLDDDNVQGALKAVRDEVAKQLGIDDGDPRLTWRYEQEKGDYAVRVRIETREAEAA